MSRVQVALAVLTLTLLAYGSEYRSEFAAESAAQTNAAAALIRALMPLHLGCANDTIPTGRQLTAR